MILNIILAVVFVLSLANVALVQANAEASAAAKSAIRAHGIAGVSLAFIIPVCAVILVGLWTWYAVDVHDWRFAALVWIPWVGNLISRFARRSGVSR